MQRKPKSIEKHLRYDGKFMNLKILKRKFIAFLSAYSRYPLPSFCLSFDSAQDDKQKACLPQAGFFTAIGAIEQNAIPLT